MTIIYKKDIILKNIQDSLEILQAIPYNIVTLYYMKEGVRGGWRYDIGRTKADSYWRIYQFDENKSTWAGNKQRTWLSNQDNKS